MKLEPLDEIILLGQGSTRSLECLIAIELSSIPDIQELKSGAEKAQKKFPKTSKFSVEINHYSNLEAFINEPLESLWHLKQGIIRKDNKVMLALKMNHVLGDAVSMILWLRSQLGATTPDSSLKLLSFPLKKDSVYRNFLPSEVWPHESKISFERKLTYLTLEHKERFGEFSVNDVLSLALLKSLPVERKALWVPVNIREKAWEGFGNGLSRMRIYPSRNAASTEEELDFIKSQKREARTSGEIFSPSPDFRLDGKIKQGLFKIWLNRPWADWGSVSLSHLHDRENILPECDGVWGVSNLPEKQQAGLFAFTKKNKTWLTLTMDASSYQERVASEILEALHENFHRIIREIK